MKELARVPRVQKKDIKEQNQKKTPEVDPRTQEDEVAVMVIKKRKKKKVK